MPDECDPDCNGNGTPDRCEIARGEATDCNQNGVVDACESPVANGNGVPDPCDIASGSSADCNTNGRPDEADLASQLGFTQTPGEPEGFVSAASADLDGDGDMDVALLAPDLVLHWNNGGTFSRGAMLSTHGGLSQRPGTVTPGVFAADLDDDADADLVAFAAELSCPDNKRASVVTVWVNDGSGTFERLHTLLIPALQFETLGVADMDDDRDSDFVAIARDGLWLIEGTGAAAFAPPREVFSYESDPARSQSRHIEVVDIDGDRVLDLVTDCGIDDYQRGEWPLRSWRGTAGVRRTRRGRPGRRWRHRSPHWRATRVERRGWNFRHGRELIDRCFGWQHCHGFRWQRHS